jgi:hypothetical protein
VALSKWLEGKSFVSPGPEASHAVLDVLSRQKPVPGFVKSLESWSILGLTSLLVGGTAGYLIYAQSNYHLGTPGVRVVSEIIYGQDDQATGTNDMFVAGTNRVLLPQKVLNYAGTNQPIPRSVYDWLPKDTVYGLCLYQAPDGFSILNNVVLMGRDRTSIHQPQYCLPANGLWVTKTESDLIRIPRPHPYDLPVMKLTAKSTVQLPDQRPNPLRAVFVYWFVADRELTADHAQRMWWMSRDLVLHSVLQRWAYSSVLGYCNEGGEEALYARLKEFIAASVPEYQITTGPTVK